MVIRTRMGYRYICIFKNIPKWFSFIVRSGKHYLGVSKVYRYIYIDRYAYEYIYTHPQMAKYYRNVLLFVCHYFVVSNYPIHFHAITSNIGLILSAPHPLHSYLLPNISQLLQVCTYWCLLLKCSFFPHLHYSLLPPPCFLLVLHDSVSLTAVEI